TEPAEEPVSCGQLHLVSLSLAKCMWETLESVMRASRIVAQRVSGASGFSAPPIKPWPVAYVCRTGAGIQEPSPIVDCRETVRGARMAEGERAQRTRGFENGPLSGSLGCSPCRRHGRPP